MHVVADECEKLQNLGVTAPDLALTTTVTFISAGLSDADLAARYGKHQLATLLPSTNLVDAPIPGERLRRRASECEGILYKGNPIA